MQKTADIDDFASGGPKPVDPSRYRPISIRREPTKLDKALIDAGSSQLFGPIFDDPGDPIAADMSSPGKGAAMYGALAGLLGAAAGKGVSKLSKELGPEYALDEKKSMIAGGATTAVLAAMAAYISRYRKNAELKDQMLRLPSGATRRDVSLNPVLGSEINPEYVKQMGIMNAALKGRLPKEWMTGEA